MDKSYLEYLKRGYGQDHEFYDWQLSRDRKPVKLEGGIKLAINFVVPCAFFPLNPSGVPFKHPHGMKTPYPDLRHFTVRDYGNRVGVFRILEAFEGAKLKAGFAVDAMTAKRCAPLIDAIKAGRHEVIAHGVSSDHIHHEGLSAEQEYDLIAKSLSSVGENVKGWLSPARNQSSRTLKKLACAGLAYNLDWEMDSVPVAAKTEHGEITLLPNSYELADDTLLLTRTQSEQEWQTQILTAVDYMREEYDRFGSQCLTLTLTPYVIGQPFRVKALRELLAELSERKDVAIMTPHEVVQAFS